MCIQTIDWALETASKAEARGDMANAMLYQEIATECIGTECPEVPVGGTGFFVKAERQGKTIIH
jgi:hypothetical protein